MAEKGPQQLPQVPLPGLGKKGVTIMGHHFSNDAILMALAGVVAAVVLFRIGKPSVAPVAGLQADPYQPGLPPASVEGTTSSSGGVISGSGYPGPADPPLGRPAAAPSGASPAPTVQPAYTSPTGVPQTLGAMAATGAARGVLQDTRGSASSMWDAAHALAEAAAAARASSPASRAAAGAAAGAGATTFGGAAPQSIDAGSNSQPVARQRPVAV